MRFQKIKQQRGEFSKEYNAAKTAMSAVWQGLLAYDVNKDNKVKKLRNVLYQNFCNLQHFSNKNCVYGYKNSLYILTFLS